MNLNQTDLIVSDVRKSAKDFQKILNIEPDVLEDRFAQFTIGDHCLMLSPDALVPIETTASGIIVHIEVEDVDSEFRRMKEVSVTTLMEPSTTDWGTYSLLIKGPEGIVIDLYQFVSK